MEIGRPTRQGLGTEMMMVALLRGVTQPKENRGRGEGTITHEEKDPRRFLS